MKKIKTLITLILVISMLSSIMVGCGKKEETNNNQGTTSQTEDTKKDDAATQDDKTADSDTPAEIKQFTMFNAVPGTEVPDDNRLLNVIKEKLEHGQRLHGLPDRQQKRESV